MRVYVLLERRARKWMEMGKLWFSGLASGREYTDFRRPVMTATPLTKEHLRASRRARWGQTAGMVVALMLLTEIATWWWKEDATVPYAWSIVQARLHMVRVPVPDMVPIPNKPYAMGQYEVTFKEYDAYAKLTGRRAPLDEGWDREERPVINVSWDEATTHARWLSQVTGKRYRLPTGQEWEYAASSGGKGEQWADTSRQCELQDYAWYSDNSQGQTQPVGMKQANGLRLHDMSGNVWEWVRDCYDERVDEDTCARRMLRGGAWLNSPGDVHVSSRIGTLADTRLSSFGFRLAQDLP